MKKNKCLENVLLGYGKFSDDFIQSLCQAAVPYEGDIKKPQTLEWLYQHGTWLIGEGHIRIQEELYGKEVVRFYGAGDNLCNLPDFFSDRAEVYYFPETVLYCLSDEVGITLENNFNMLKLVNLMQRRMIQRESRWNHMQTLPEKELKYEMFKKMFPGLLPLLSKSDNYLAFNISRITLYRFLKERV